MNSYSSYSRECLWQLGTSYRNLQRRGQAKNPSNSLSQLSPSSSTSAQTQTKAALKMRIVQENAFKPVAQTFFDQVTQTANAGLLPATANVGSLIPSSVSSGTSTAVAKVPAIFQRLVQKTVPSDVQGKALEVQAKATDAQKRVMKYEQWLLNICKGITPQAVLSSKPWKHLFEPQLGYSVNKCMPNTALDCWAASSRRHSESA